MSRFQQVYYTSCEAGVRGGKGFQILAHSDGMPQPLLRAIEQLAAYSPPRSAPTRPNTDDIARFPISLLYQRLKDGTPIIARNRYVGRDYSGRFGNFFMHALVPETPALSVPPISLWGAPFWIHENGESSRALPCHHLDGQAALDLAAVGRFIAEGDRMSWVSRFLGAVENALTSGRRIILVDTDVNVARWVMLACSLLPDPLAVNLTFDTYARSPYERDVLVVGTTTDSDFRFSPHEMEYQFYVFDFAGTRSSRTLPETPFSRQVTEACRAGRFEEAARFANFVRAKQLDLAPDNLSDAYTYYALQVGLPVDRPATAAVLRWCAANLSIVDPSTLRAVCDRLLDACTTDEQPAAEAAHALLAACESAGDRRAVDACREALAPWLSEVATRAEAIDWIPPLLRTPPSLQHDYPASVALDMRRKVDACADPRRCLVLLDLLDATGALRQPATRARELGADKLDLLLSVPEGQAFLHDRVPAGAWREFFAGAIGRREEALRGASELPAAWLRFLADDDVRGEISSIAMSAGAAALQTEIGRMGMAAGVDPVKAFGRCLRSEPKRDAESLDRLSERLFGAHPLHMEQAAGVAAQLRGLQVSPALYERLGAPLLADAELRRDLPARRHLATALQELSCTREVPEITHLANLISLLAHVTDHPAVLRPAHIVQIEQHLRWMPDPFMLPALVRVAAALSHACARQEWPVHRACFTECVEVFGPANFQPLLSFALRKTLDQMSVMDGEETVASLFAAWCPLHRTRPTSSSGYILRELLPAACLGWEDIRLNSVRLKLSAWSTHGGVTGLSTMWRDWLADQQPTFWQKLNPWSGRR